MMESLSSNGVESTRVEQMAQKQNKIAQNLLEDKLRELEKETTLSKLHYRIFIKQLRYDIVQTRKCTGYSTEAQPPTEKPPDMRRRVAPTRSRATSRENNIPAVSQALKLEEKVDYLRSIPEDRMLADSSTTLPSINITEHTSPKTSIFLTESAHETSTKELVKLTDSSGEDLTEDRRRVGEASHALSSGHLASNSQLDVKFKEPKPVLKMPTIFQTEKMKSLRTSQIQTRFLPPIVPIKKTNENLAENKTSPYADVENPETVPLKADNIAEEQPKKHLGISEILKASLQKAAKLRAEEKRNQKTKKSVKKLLTENPMGLYRPENAKLIHKTFKREELFNEHRTLLEQNASLKNFSTAKMGGTDRANIKVQAFLTDFKL